MPFVTVVETEDGPIRCHLTLGKPPRVVPAAERHKWSRVPRRGETARCLKCGCVKCYRLTYDTVYRLKNSTAILTERPACTGLATEELEYICDDARHLICTPYSVTNLHAMARTLGIKRCWFHATPGKAHYDIPESRIEEITTKCRIVSTREILKIIKGE